MEFRRLFQSVKKYAILAAYRNADGLVPLDDKKLFGGFGEGDFKEALSDGWEAWKMWYVIQVYTGYEEEVAGQCRMRVLEDGEEAFIPQVERMTKVCGEWGLALTRLFPGYVFLESDEPESLYERLKRIRIMTRLLKTGEEITPLYRDEEEYLRKLQDVGHVVRYSEGYLEGDRLFITSGALKGCEGKVKKILRHKRLAVLEVPLLGREVEVTLGLGVLEKRQD